MRVPDVPIGLRCGLRVIRINRLEVILEGQRLLWNAALEARRQTWGKLHGSATRID